MANSPLVTSQWLEEHLDDPNVRILEISTKNDKTLYREGHIPGALWFYWKDICWHETDRQFVSPETMAKRLGKIGITPKTTLVLYSDKVQFGTYTFWALKMAGHADIRLVDGSRTKWVQDGRPLTKNVPRFDPVEYAPREGDASMRIGRDAVREKLGQPGLVLLDARSPEEYSGERVAAFPNFNHGAERAGRIPGAVHLFFRNLVNSDDTFKSPEALQALFDAAGAAPGKADEIICYCRLSHRATLLWTAMTYILGYDNAKIYDGSWTEWGSVIGFPVER